MPGINYAALTAELAFRKMTSFRRTLPQVYLLGGMKCGTTFMYEILRRHPNFRAPFSNMNQLSYLQDLPDYNPYEFKGVLKIVFDAFFGQYNGAGSYRKFFPLKNQMRSIEKRTGHNAITGDFTPIYLYCPIAAQRIKKMTPGAKLIILLRNPVHRAYSEYSVMSVRYEQRSFESAIRDELDGISHQDYLTDTYIKKGIYEPYIRMYYDLFDEKQIMIIRSEDFFSGTPMIVRKVFDFLGLPYEGFEVDYDPLFKNDTFYSRRMKDETRRFLTDYYRPYNEKLYDFLGMDMGWDSVNVKSVSIT